MTADDAVGAKGAGFLRRPRIGARLLSAVEGLVHYGNPLHIAGRRLFGSGNGVMTITDRRTGLSFVAAARSYQMFGETWYRRDYDVPGCPLRPGDVVVDIGANQGFYACYAASKGAYVHAFEPFEPSFRRLQQNAERNGLSSRITPTLAAVSSSSGRVTMRCFDDLGGGMNSITPSHVPSYVPSETVEVSTIGINEALEQIAHPVRVCKLDCEGAELDIIRSLERPDRVASYAIEFHPGAYDVGDLVTALSRWRSHQVSFSHQSYMIYAVSNAALQEYAAGGYVAVHER